jgi:hypothetical protein
MLWPRNWGLKSNQVKGLGWVLFFLNLGNKAIYVLNSEWWCWGLCDTQNASRVLNASQSVPCFYISQRLWAHIYYTLRQWERALLSASFIPTCYIYSFFNKKWHIEYAFLEISWNPFIRFSASFSYTSASQEPNPQTQVPDANHPAARQKKMAF